MTNFSDFNLEGKIVKALDDLGYKAPTSIQQLAIPKILEGLDLIASAQTGTGKTAAFMLPILHKLVTQGLKGSPPILILVPTRELAIQVSDQAKKFSKYLDRIKTVCIYGGVPYPIQKRALASRYDILVATPGRLIDFLDQGKINLSNLKLLVLDEADRMLDMGFIDAVERIVEATPKNRQTLLFSATLDHKILPFSKKLQNNPHEIRGEVKATDTSSIEQRLYYVDDLSHKTRLLEHLLEETSEQQTIVFTSTKNQANELARQLHEKGVLAGALHGDMNQSQRTRTINKVRGGKIRVLVATDVAARGIDISSLGYVINFDLPHNPEDFIHRVGRTGRAGASGIAITFATYREDRWIARINTLLKAPMNLHSVEGMEPRGKKESKGYPSRFGRPKFQNRGYSGSDRGRSGSDRPRPNSERSYSGSERSYSSSDRGRPSSERGYAGSDRGRPSSERGYAGSDRGRAGSDRDYSESDRSRPGSDRGYAGSDRGRQGSDRGYSGSNRGARSGSERNYADSDRGRPGSDRGYAGSDRGRPGSDRGRPGQGGFAKKRGGEQRKFFKSPKRTQAGV